MNMRAAPFGAVGLLAVVSVWSSGVPAATPTSQMQHEWWQWVMATPSNDSPIYDKTGNRCGIGQRGNVWFLAGSTGGKVTRKCTVPAGVALLVPVVNNFCFPDAVYSEAQCRIDTKLFIDSFASGIVSLTVDSQPQPVTRISDESAFSFAVGYNGYGGTKPGIYRAVVADGYWSLIDPLTPGSYTLRILAQGPMFNLDVTYDLTVAAPAN